MKSAVLLLALLDISPSILVAADAPRARLWVAQGAELVEYDPRNFSRLGSVPLRPEVAQRPDLLTVNFRGQVLERSGSLPWLWTGHEGRFISEEPQLPHVPPAQGLVLTTERQWLLGGDGASVYLLQNDVWTRRAPSDSEESVTIRFHLMRYDIRTRKYSTMLEYGLERCPCETGSCFETCPFVSGWVPSGVVRDFIHLTDYVSGQLQSSHGPIVVFRGSHSRSFSPAETLEVSNCMDSDGRDILLDTNGDGACCGWSNGNSEDVTFVRGDSAIVLFQEWPTYRNENYDVSFTPTSGRVSPDGRLAAFTIGTIGGPNDTGSIPLNVDGQSDSLGLVVIRRALEDVPLVEIHVPEARPTLLRRLRKSELIGWLTSEKLLLLEGQRLVVLDARTGTRNESPIRATNRESVFLVRE